MKKGRGAVFLFTIGGFEFIILQMNAKLIGARIDALRDRLQKAGIDYFLATKQANVAYLTGFDGDDSWALISPRLVRLITDSRYTQQARLRCRCKIVERTGPMHQTVAKILAGTGREKTLAAENTLSIGTYDVLRKNLPVRLIHRKDMVENLRRTKDAGEIAMICRAAEIAAAAFKQIIAKIRPGLCESELAAMLDYNILKLGAANAFKTIVAFGANASMPHYQPKNAKLRANDTILIDFGASCGGYCCDITRSFCFGRPSRQYGLAHRAVVQAQHAVIQRIKPGVNAIELDVLAKKIIKKAGFKPYGHGLGHGTGLEVHEKPVVSSLSKDVLQAGDIITVEPGVYIAGKFGIRIEDDVLVTDAGCEILTQETASFDI